MAVELDLNGYKLSYTGIEKNNLKATIKNEGTLTISDSSKAGTGAVEAIEGNVSGNTTTSAIANLGIVTINAGTIKVTCNNGNYGYYVINNAGSVTVAGGKIVMDEKLASQSINTSVIKNGNDDLTGTNTNLGNDIKKYDGEKATLTITGGEVISPTYIKNCENGVIDVTGGKFSVPDVATSSWNQSIFFNYGDLTISGGEFNTKTTKNGDKTLGPIWAGTWDTVPSKTTVTGGTFTMGANEVLVYTYVFSDADDKDMPESVCGFEISVSTDVAKKVTNIVTIPDSTKTLEIPLSVDVGGNTLDVDLTSGAVGVIEYKDRLVISSLTRGAGNAYVSGTVSISQMSTTGTLVVSKNADVILPNGTVGTNIVNLGGTVKDSDGKTIEAGKQAVSGIKTVEELNKALARGADVEDVDVTLKDGEVITVSGSMISGHVKYGTTDDILLENLKGEFTITAGKSIDIDASKIEGTINVWDGAVELTGKVTGKLIVNTGTKSTDKIAKFSDFTVNSGAELVLKGKGTFTVVADKSFNLYGSLATEGVTAPSTISVTVPEKASFKAYSGSQIAGTILVTGPATGKTGNIDLSQAQNPQSVGEDISYDKIYGQLENVTIVDSLTIKNSSTVTVKGGFNVNEGVTLTIEKGSYLIIDSEAASMVVAGKIVVEDGAYLTVTNAKDVKVSGSIESEGTVSINSTVTIKSGGSIVINDNSVTESNKTIYKSTFSATQGLTVEAGAELIIKSLVVSTKDSAGNAVPTVVTNKGTVTLDGAVLGGDFTVNMAADKAVVQVLNVQSEKSKTGTVTITDAGLKFADKKTIVGTTEGTVANEVTISVGNNVVKGLTVVETVSSKTVDGQTKYYNTLDLAGAVSVSAAEDGKDATEQSVAVSGQRIAVTGELTLGKKATLTVEKEAKLSVTGKLVATEENSKVANSGEITVTGLIQVIGSSTTKIADVINAAMYETKSGTTTLYNYTTLKAAVDAAAKDITVTGTIYVTESFTVPSGTTVKGDGQIVIGSAENTDVELTFADGAVAKTVRFDVDGTLYFENNKTGNKASEIISDVTVIGEKDARYTNVYTALAKANAGETVTVTGETVDLKKNITIKEGVTLDVPNSKTLKVFAGVTITVNGTLKVAEKIETGTYDKSETEKGLPVQFALAADKLTGKAAIVVSGVFMSGVQFSYNGETKDVPVYMIPGAYYHLTDSVGDYYYATTLETASKSAATAVDVYGKVTAGDVAFAGTDSSKKTVTVKAEADLTAASITLDKTTFVVDKDGKFTGDIKAGESAVTVKYVTEMTVSVVDDVFTVDGAAKYQQLKEGEKASFTVSAGSVYIKTASMAVKVASGATLVSGKDDTTITGTLTIEGTVAAANEQTITVNGDVVVKGTLTVAAATDSKGAGTFNANGKLYIGITDSDLHDDDVELNTGDAASVTGAVTGVKVAFVKADATVSEATIDSFKVNGVLKSTTYIVEDKDWITAYAVGGDLYINYVNIAPVENAEFKYWQNTDGDVVKYTSNIGDSKCDKVTASIDYEIYAILVNPAAGIESIAVDGNLMQFGSFRDNDSSYVQTQMYYIVVKAGTHDITCKLANGYSGEAKFAIVDSQTTDGLNASISGNKVTVSGDKGSVLVQITGISASGYVQPTEPAQDDKDDGLSLTDILLIILVVLIVVMAIIVALRLMRS